VSTEQPLVLINAFEVPGDRDDDAATSSDGFRAAAAGLAAFRSHPGLYRVART
jgi:hypothetical protein